MHDEKMIFSLKDIEEMSEIINSAFLGFFLVLLSNTLFKISIDEDPAIESYQNKMFQQIDDTADKLYRHNKNRNHDTSRAKVIAAKAIVRFTS